MMETDDNTENMDTEKPVIREICCLVFGSEGSYQNHKSACCGRKPIGQIEMEIKMEENDENEIHVCSVCQMIFSSEDLWRNHSLNCSENKPFVCEVCHLGCREEEEMIQHKRGTSRHRKLFLCGCITRRC